MEGFNYVLKSQQNRGSQLRVLSKIPHVQFIGGASDLLVNIDQGFLVSFF